MEIRLPEFAFVALIGTSGSGKSHFAAQHFNPGEIVSQAQFEAMTGDDGTDEGLHAETIALMHQAIEIRLRHRKATIVDATLLKPQDRAELRRLARKYHVRLAAIVLDTPLETCIARNTERLGSPDRQLIRAQAQLMEQTASYLKEEGLRPNYQIRPEDVEIEIVRYKAASDRREVTGGLDLIGDVHGCLSELLALLDRLGYEVSATEIASPEVDPHGAALPKLGRHKISLHHPRGRRLVFVGDLCDRGPDSPGVIRLVMDAVAQGMALCVPGNHDDKLMRKLSGNNVQLKHGLEKTMAQLEGADPAFLEEIRAFIDGLPSHLELDGGQLVVAHAGLKAGMHGRHSGEIHSFCLYGETTGETDEFGLPVRQNWAADYDGQALVVYGHTPIPEPSWQNNTVNIDTGCVFGGELTALRYPERSTIAVPAQTIWCQPSRPMHWIGVQKSTQAVDHSISMATISPQMLVSTSDGYNLNLDEATYTHLLAHVSERAVHARWLLYAPPSYGPPTVSPIAGLLEHPAQAIDYYRKKSVTLLAARPMLHGTTVTIVLCRDAAVATQRFGLDNQGIGAIYTRSGRPYFGEVAETQLRLGQMARALEAADVWSLLKSDWLCLEAVVVPIGHKAPAFVPQVYAEVAATGLHSVERAQAKLEMAKARGLAVDDSLQRLALEKQSLQAFREAYRQMAGPEIAEPQFHLQQLLAVEGQVLLGKSQEMQQALLAPIAAALGSAFVAATLLQADLDSESSLRALTAWWENHNLQGGAGLMIGPLEMMVAREGEMMQPWIKVRCPEYLRLRYGPAYDAPATMQALQDRNLRLKRETVVRSYSLAREGLRRFVGGQPFDEVFQCIFTTLGLEMAVVDARF
jgi:protein phosphatase